MKYRFIKRLKFFKLGNTKKEETVPEKKEEAVVASENKAKRLLSWASDSDLVKSHTYDQPPEEQKGGLAIVEDNIYKKKLREQAVTKKEEIKDEKTLELQQQIQKEKEVLIEKYEKKVAKLNNRLEELVTRQRTDIGDLYGPIPPSTEESYSYAADSISYQSADTMSAVSSVSARDRLQQKQRAMGMTAEEMMRDKIAAKEKQLKNKKEPPKYPELVVVKKVSTKKNGPEEISDTASSTRSSTQLFVVNDSGRSNHHQRGKQPKKEQQKEHSGFVVGSSSRSRSTKASRTRTLRASERAAYSFSSSSSSSGSYIEKSSVVLSEKAREKYPSRREETRRKTKKGSRNASPRNRKKDPTTRGRTRQGKNSNHQSYLRYYSNKRFDDADSFSGSDDLSFMSWGSSSSSSSFDFFLGSRKAGLGMK
mmetsp:Transcript_7033/g.11125  ORF Transcript_7033/g.11125 Transcript_7033/m.11125 type:complete len:422 (+) Transcript_7033:124-1389(+)